MNKKVLVVDDEADLREPVAEALRLEGYIVLEADDGKKAVQIGLAEKPDIILMDIMMPEMNGTDALHEIRKNRPWGEKVPVIMLSAMSDPTSVATAVQDGTIDYLIKTNWSLAEIIKKVKANIVEYS